MIPSIPELNTQMVTSEIPSRTYKLHFDIDRLSGWTEDQTALIQSIYMILSTERYKYIIYSWNYGIELFDLFGKQIPYVESELERRITDALIVDDRIESVSNFRFEEYGNKVHVTFTVTSVFGNIDTEMEVEV